MTYLEPNHPHHVRDYAKLIINGFRVLTPDSWSARSLENSLKEREYSGDWTGFRGVVEENAKHLLSLERSAARAEWNRFSGGI